jgi:cytidine deaminase
MESLEALLGAARAVRDMAHAPYSHFQVGAALIDERGLIHAGCNVENSAYPQSLCAEAGAIAAMVAAGGKRIEAVVVVGEGEQPCMPCGGCRQKLREFARDDMPVIVADMQQVRGRFTLGELLPHGFGPENLE